MFLTNNPEFIRMLRTRLRPRALVARAVFMALLFSGILVVLYWIDRTSGSPIPMLRIYFIAVAGIQLALLCILGLTQASQNVVLERERNTYDFQRLVAMGPWHLTFGKLYGGAIDAWWLVLSSLPFLMLPVAFREVPVSVLLQVIALEFTLGTLVCAVGLFSSVVVDKVSQSSGLALLTVAFFFAFTLIVSSACGPGLNLWTSWSPIQALTALYASLNSESSYPVIAFLGLDRVPMIVGCMLVNGLFSGIFFCMTARRIADPELSLLSREQVFGAYVVCQVLVIGSVWSNLSMNPVKVLMTYHGVSAILLCLAPFVLLPSGDLLKSRAHRCARNDHWRMVSGFGSRSQDGSPLAPQLVMTLLYAGLALFMTWFASKDVELLHGPATAGTLWAGVTPLIVMVSALGFTCSMLALYIQVATEKNGLQLGMVLLVFLLILPSAAVAILVSPLHTVYVNPAAYLFVSGCLVEAKDHYAIMKEPNATWALPLIFCVTALLLGALSAMRFRYLLDMAHADRQRQAQLDRQAPGLDASGKAAALIAERVRTAAEHAFPRAEESASPPERSEGRAIQGETDGT